MTKELLKECYDELAKLNGLVVKSEGVNCQYDELLDKLSKELLRKEETIEDYYNEWEQAIDELHTKTKKLTEIKEAYSQMEQDILVTTDFKKLYGANNDKVRKNHIKNELKDLDDEKHELELRIDYLKRRIEYINNKLVMESTLLKCGYTIIE